MNDFVIQFFGIVMFVAASGTGPSNPRMAVVPTHPNMTTHQGKKVHAHVAYIAFPLKGAVIDWNNEKPQDHPTIGGFGYFELNGYTLSVNAADQKLNVLPSHTNLVKRIRDYCPDFEYDDTKAAAAMIPVAVGELSAKVGQGSAVYSEWKVKTTGNLVITAVPKNGPNRTITLPPGSRVVIGNQTPEFMKTTSDPPNHSHFYIYYEYDKHPNTCTKQPSDGVKPKDKDRDSDVDCSNSHYP